MVIVYAMLNQWRRVVERHELHGSIDQVADRYRHRFEILLRWYHDVSC
jgi:hypothetical protein